MRALGWSLSIWQIKKSAGNKRKEYQTEICFYVINIKQVVQEALPIMVIRKKLIYMHREWEKEEIKNCLHNIYHGINRKWLIESAEIYWNSPLHE